MISPSTGEAKKAGFPYLVDICITKKCDRGCEFCYADAKPDGKEADKWWVGSGLLEALLKAGTMEVVFGGGEPTLSDGLAYFISSYHQKRFKVGMTTRNYGFHKDKHFKECVPGLSSIGISCETAGDVEEAMPLAKALFKLSLEDSNKGDYRSRSPVVSIHIQTILGLKPWNTTRELVAAAASRKGRESGIRTVTFLSLRNVGRAAKAKGHPLTPGWIDEVSKSGLSVGADSGICKEWGPELAARGVKRMHIVGDDGMSTMFVDAVDMVAKPSSFSDRKVRLDKSPDITEVFRSL